MNLTKLLCTLVLLVIFSNAQAQILGGTLPGDPTPQAAQVSDLSGNISKGDVDLFTGSYGHQLNLGTVSTPGGLSFSLNLNYNSSQMAGKHMPLTNGLLYGYGWELGVPKVSIEYFQYKDETDLQRQNFISSTGSIGSLGNSIIGETNMHGAVLWEAPHVSIPGVFSGRMILKRYDDRKNNYVFVPYEFSDYCELIISEGGNKWEFHTSEGIVYEFGLSKRVFRESLNTRDFHYDDSITPNTLGANANPNQIVSGKLKRSHIPKSQVLEWYCTRIWNKRTPRFQGITFDYESFGKFNHFKEFSEDYDKGLATKVAQKLYGDSITVWQNNVFLDSAGYHISVTTGSSTQASYAFNLINLESYEDIVLKEVVAYDLVAPVQRIELGYKTHNLGLAHSLQLGAQGVHVHDSLNLYKSVFYNGQSTHSSAHTFDSDKSLNFFDPSSHVFYPVAAANSTSKFKNWKRYLHAKHDEVQLLNSYNPSSTNPYLQVTGSTSRTLNRKFLGTNETNLDFDHGYLESEYQVGLIAGEKYEIRTRVSLNHNTAEQELFLFDINIATDRTPTSGSTNVQPLSSNFLDNIKPIFSTFHKGMKWEVSNFTDRHRTRATSNIFTVPNNIRSNDRFVIQVGPANSDHLFSSYKFGVNNDFALPANADGKRTRALKHYLPELYNDNNISLASQSSHQNAAVPQNFGVGLPWHQLRGVYQELAPYHPDGVYNFWWMNTLDQNSSSINPLNLQNVPTSSGAAKLHDVELIRYAKNSYMLDYVSVEVLNGEAIGSQGPGWARTKYLEFEYENEVGMVRTNNLKFNVVNSCVQPYPISTSTNTVDSTGRAAYENDVARNFIVLSKVKQLPISTTNFYDVVSGQPITASSFNYSMQSWYKPNNGRTHTEMVRAAQMQTWTPVILLTSFNDQLGKETKVEYHDMLDLESHFQILDWGKGDALESRSIQLTVPVKHVLVSSENNQYDSITYEYDKTSFRRLADITQTAVGPSGKVTYNGYHAKGRSGYGKVTTYSSQLNGRRVKEEYFFHNVPAHPESTVPIYDCATSTSTPLYELHRIQVDTAWNTGKLKEKRTYDGNGFLTSKETHTYTRRKAYEAANKRPIPTFNVYDKTDYADYNVVIPGNAGNYTGFTGALMLRVGALTKIETPVCLYGGSSNFRDSYFVTLSEKEVTTYDYNNCQNPAGNNPSGFDNPIGTTGSGAMQLIIDKLKDGKYVEKENLLMSDVSPEFPLSDALLHEIIKPENKVSNPTVEEILVAQPDLSDNVLFYMLENRIEFPDKHLTSVLISTPFALSDTVLYYIDKNRSTYYAKSGIQELSDKLPERPLGPITNLDQTYSNSTVTREEVVSTIQDLRENKEKLLGYLEEIGLLSDDELLTVLDYVTNGETIEKILLDQKDLSDGILIKVVVSTTLKANQIQHILKMVPHVVSETIILTLCEEQEKFEKAEFIAIILDHPFLSQASYEHLRTELRDRNTDLSQQVFLALQNVPDNVLSAILSTNFFESPADLRQFVINQSNTISEATMASVAQKASWLGGEALAVFTNPSLQYGSQAMSYISASSLSLEVKDAISKYWNGQSTNACNESNLATTLGVTIKEEYDYYWAHPNGTTQATGYQLLMNKGTNSTVTLHYEPSWKLFRKTTSSPQQPQLTQQEENYYLYDLYNRYRPDSHVQLDYQFNAGVITSPKFIDLAQGDTTSQSLESYQSAVDSLVNLINLDSTAVDSNSWKVYHLPSYTIYDYTGFSSYADPDKMIGAKLSRKHGVRGLVYQKVNVLENGTEKAPTIQEQYFNYHSYWPEPLLPINKTELLDPMPCDVDINPYNDPLIAQGCSFFKPGVQVLPDGYIQWQLEIDTLPEDRHYACPCGLIDTAVISDNFFPVASNPDIALVSLLTTNTCMGTSPIITSMPSFGLPYIGNFIFKDILMPAEELVKLDTILSDDYDSLNTAYGNNMLFNRGRHLMEFLEINTSNVNTRKKSRYVLPYESLSKWEIFEINAEGLPQYVRDEKYIHTRFHYDTAYFVWKKDPNCHANSYSVSLHTNVGVPTKITQGSNLHYRNLGITLPVTLRHQGVPDSVNTFYSYNKNYSLERIEGPNNQTSEFTYDEFGRLTASYRNGVMLQKTDYTIWNGDETLSFEDRATQNRIKTCTTAEDNNSVGTCTYTWIDPKGRTYNSASAVGNIFNNSDQAVSIDYSGRTIYDEWNRVKRQYQSFTYEDTTTTSPIIPRFAALDTTSWPNTFVETRYDYRKASRPTRVADFGQQLFTDPNKTMGYGYITSSCFKCELNLTNYEAMQVLGDNFSQHPNQVIRVEEGKDEDGNIQRAYYNAFNQQLATLQVNGSESPVTLFKYDNAGNVSKVIHPSKLETKNHYNLVGLLWKKETPDEDTWRYVYNRSGQLRFEVNRGSLQKITTGDQTSYYTMREYRYDHFGRLLEQKLHLRKMHDQVPDKFFWDVPLDFNLNISGGGPADFLTITKFHAGHSLAYDFLSSYTWLTDIPYAGNGKEKRLQWPEQLVAGVLAPPVNVLNMDNDLEVTLMSGEDDYNQLIFWSTGQPIANLYEKKFIYSQPHVTNLSAPALNKVLNEQQNTLGRITGSIAYKYPFDITDYHQFVSHSSSSSIYHQKHQVEVKAYSYNNDGEIEWEVGQVNPNGIANTQKGLAYLIDYPLYNTQGQAIVQDVDINIDDTLDIRYIHDINVRGNLERVYAQFEEPINDRHLINTNSYNTAYGYLEEQAYYRPCSGSSNALPSKADNVTYQFNERMALTNISSNYYKEALAYHADTLMQAGASVQQSANYNGNINSTRHSYQLQSMENYIGGHFDQPTLYGYQYDSLNRLTHADAYIGDQVALSAAQGALVGDAEFSYNTMSSLTDLKRTLPYSVQQGAVSEQSWKYNYGANTHQITNVNGLGSTPSAGFVFDYLGNIVQDDYRNISNTLYGHSNLAYEVHTTDFISNYMYGATNARIFKEVEKRIANPNVSPISVAEFYLHDHAGRNLGVLDMQDGNWQWYVYADKRIAKIIPHQNQQPHYYPTVWSNDSTFDNGVIGLPIYLDFVQMASGGKIGGGASNEITLVSIEEQVRAYDIEAWQDALAAYPQLEESVVGRFTLEPSDQLLALKEPTQGIDHIIHLNALGLKPQDPIISPSDGQKQLPEDPGLAVPTGYWNTHSSPAADSVIFYVHDHLGNTRVAYSHQLADCSPYNDTTITVSGVDTTLTLLSSAIDTIIFGWDPVLGDHQDTIWTYVYDTTFTTYYDTLVTTVMENQLTVLHQATDYYPYGKVLRMLQYDPQRHRLQGNMHDDETGLEYFNARNLESDLAFFRSVDPLSLHPNQVNKSPYQAFWGNPMSRPDPSGECPTCPGNWLTNNAYSRALMNEELSANSESLSRNVDKTVKAKVGTQVMGVGAGINVDGVGFNAKARILPVDYAASSNGEQSLSASAVSANVGAQYGPLKARSGFNIMNVSANSNGEVTTSEASFNTSASGNSGNTGVSYDGDDFITTFTIVVGEVSVSITTNLNALGDAANDYFEGIKLYVKSLYEEATSHSDKKYTPDEFEEDYYR